MFFKEAKCFWRHAKNSQPIKHVIEQVVNKQQTSTYPTPRQALVPSINNRNNQNISNVANGRTLEKKINNEFPENQFLDPPNQKKKKWREKKENEKTDAPAQFKNGRQLEIFEIIPPRLDDVKAFFETMKIDAVESERFFNHFQSNGWLVGGKSKMKNWQASAKNWILNLAAFNPVPISVTTPNPGNLKTSNQKKYDEPL